MCVVGLAGHDHETAIAPELSSHPWEQRAAQDRREASPVPKKLFCSHIRTLGTASELSFGAHDAPEMLSARPLQGRAPPEQLALTCSRINKRKHNLTAQNQQILTGKSNPQVFVFLVSIHKDIRYPLLKWQGIFFFKMQVLI